MVVYRYEVNVKKTIVKAPERFVEVVTSKRTNQNTIVRGYEMVRGEDTLRSGEVKKYRRKIQFFRDHDSEEAANSDRDRTTHGFKVDSMYTKYNSYAPPQRERDATGETSES